MPHAYLDVGRMMREPTDIVLRVDIPERDESGQAVEAWARGLLGHGYAASMKPSPLIGRIVRMEGEIDHGEDTLEHKLRYLIWFN
jgi:hypothetical protein